ncbi:Hypothetical protein CM240_2013 [Clostridium bornimense]|uniref:Preprotein translocase subunit YajC n=1 Tax=Clostridium bornimense TaxID=1216932 RepID=W6RWW9_9CLOT|nr:preprotein translocase subunit YajC [Clostridium bornimense]CDM69171.1 Hypothetical protein CM240_2013 [Clostridium bornimense]
MQWMQLLFPIVLLGLMYLMIFLPESKRRKKFAKMLSDIKVNDKIMTKGGIIGKIVKIQDDTIVIVSGPDKVKIEFTKEAIGTVLTDEVAK